MKIFAVGIVLACAGTGVVQLATAPQHEQAQAAPAPQTTQDTYVHPSSIPFDAATYNMNSMPYASVDSGDDPAKLWDESGDSTARSAEGWDGVSPSLPTSPSAKTGSASSKSTTSKSKTSTKTGQASTKAKTSATASAAPKVTQGTKGALATPQTLSQGPSVKPVKIPLY